MKNDLEVAYADQRLEHDAGEGCLLVDHYDLEVDSHQHSGPGSSCSQDFALPGHLSVAVETVTENLGRGVEAEQTTNRLVAASLAEEDCGLRHPYSLAPDFWISHGHDVEVDVVDGSHCFVCVEELQSVHQRLLRRFRASKPDHSESPVN